MTLSANAVTTTGANMVPESMCRSRSSTGIPLVIVSISIELCDVSRSTGDIGAEKKNSWIFADRPCIAMRHVEASTTTVPDDSGYADGRHASLSGISDQYSSSLRMY